MSWVSGTGCTWFCLGCHRKHYRPGGLSSRHVFCRQFWRGDAKERGARGAHLFCILSSVPIANSHVRSQSDLSTLPERTSSLGGPTSSRAISVELRYEDEKWRRPFQRRHKWCMTQASFSPEREETAWGRVRRCWCYRSSRGWRDKGERESATTLIVLNHHNNSMYVSCI